MVACVRQCEVMLLTLPSERQTVREVIAEHKAVKREIASIQHSTIKALFSYYIGFLICQLTAGFFFRSNLNSLLTNEQRLDGKRVQEYKHLAFVARSRLIGLFGVGSVLLIAARSYHLLLRHPTHEGVCLQKSVTDPINKGLVDLSVCEALPWMIMGSGVMSYCLGRYFKALGVHCHQRLNQAQRFGNQ